MNRYSRELAQHVRREAEPLLFQEAFDAGKPFTADGVNEWTCRVCDETVGRGEGIARDRRLLECSHLIALHEQACADLTAEYRPRLVETIIGRSEIPRRFTAATFDSFEPVQGAAKVGDFMRRWVEAYEPGAKGLLLVGRYGSGKTHLAVAALRAAIERHLVDGRFASSTDLARKLMQGDGTRFLNYEVAEQAVSHELLVLDDIGQESPSPKIRELLFEIIDGRYRENRSTILTSNAGTADIASRIGGAVASRLTEMTDVLVLKAADYRARRVA